MAPHMGPQRSVLLIRPSMRMINPQSGAPRIASAPQQFQQQSRLAAVMSESNPTVHSLSMQQQLLPQYAQPQPLQSTPQKQQLKVHGYDADMDVSSAPVATVLQNEPKSMRMENMKAAMVRPAMNKPFRSQGLRLPGTSQSVPPPPSNRKVILERQVSSSCFGCS